MAGWLGAGVAGATVILTIIVTEGVPTMSLSSLTTFLPGRCSSPIFLNEETESQRGET